MKKYLSLMLLFSLMVIGCSGEEPKVEEEPMGWRSTEELVLDGDIEPLNWISDNQTTDNVKIDVSSEFVWLISSDKNGGHVSITNVDGFEDFDAVSICERGFGNKYLKSLIARMPIVKDGEVTGHEIWKNEGKNKINADDLPLEYSCDWIKVHIKYPVVDIEFLPFDGESDQSRIEINFEFPGYFSRFILTRE